MVLDDRRMKVREIAETIGISKEQVGYILHEELDMKKLCAKWVPSLLTADQKRTSMKISEQCLERFNKNKIDLVVCFLLGNSPVSEFYMPTFRNTLFHLHRPMKMEQTVFRKVGI